MGVEAPAIAAAPAPPAPAVDTAAFEATTNRAALHAFHPIEASAEAAPPSAPAAARDVPSATYRSPIPTPPLVWLVALGLGIVGLLLIYPMLRYGFQDLPHVFGSDKFERAFAALLLYALLAFAGTGIALFALAVGLVRCNRVAQLLTCLVCGVVSIAAMATLSDSTADGTSTLAHGSTIAVLLVPLVMIVLVTMPPDVREYFAQDSDRPFGVLIAAATAIYIGWVLAVLGVLLLVVGTIDGKYVAAGLGLLAGGIALIASTRGLRTGSNTARAVVSGAFVLCIIMVFVADGSGGLSFGEVLPFGLGLTALAGMWLPRSSQDHFAVRQGV